MGKKTKTLDQFIEEAKNIHNNKYDYSKVNYINLKTKIEIICTKHGLFQQTPKDHLSGCGCKKCGKENAIKTKTISKEQFIEKANIIHNNIYDYSKIEYSNTQSIIEIICTKHGSFYQKAELHLSGCGCKKCGYEIVSEKLSFSQEEFINKLKEIHNNLYDYSKTQYVNCRSNIEIICLKHGSFYQNAHNHLSGQGCPKCKTDKFIKRLSLTINEFIEKSNLIHHNKYDYSKSIYTNVSDKINIICPIHGLFEQIARDHLDGHGCRKCGHHISKLEIEWLNSLNIPDDKKHRNIYLSYNGTKFNVDGYMPEINTIYEFYGDFWHGNLELFNINDLNSPAHKTFGELYNKTIDRENLIKEAGYKIISIWENDWNKIKKEIEKNKNNIKYEFAVI